MALLTIRRFGPEDSLEELTALLHRAYAPWAAVGLKFAATHQTVETTRKRMAGAEAYVALADGRIVGTVTLFPPAWSERPRGCAWYDRDDVAKFGQWGVDPPFKGLRVGAALLDHAERRAAELGAVELACDTAAPATSLRETYVRHGYREVDACDWRPHVNYTSVVYSKPV